MDVAAAFKNNGVVPDVIPAAPEKLLTVAYGNGKNVNLGNPLTPTEVKDAPQEISWPANEGDLHTLILTDPDAPSRENPTVGDVKHWLVANIPGSDVQKGDVITPYRGSGAPKGTGLHRYTFLAFKQNAPIGADEIRDLRASSEKRLKWNAQKFAETYKLGTPVAGNFFQAEWDEYVDTMAGFE